MDYLQFDKTPYASKAVTLILKKLNITSDSDKVSVGDVLLMFELRFRIAVYISHPKDSLKDEFEFFVIDNELNLNIIDYKTSSPLREVSLNIILYKISAYLLYKNKIVPIKKEDKRFNEEVLEKLKEYLTNKDNNGHLQK